VLVVVVVVGVAVVMAVVEVALNRTTYLLQIRFENDQMRA